jgi:NAD+ diphosphatase
MPYPEEINLPFNFSYIKNDFQLSRQETFAAEEGYWAIIKGNSLVLMESNGKMFLHEGQLPAWMNPMHEALLIGTWKGKPLNGVTIVNSQELQPGFVAEPFNSADIRIGFDIMTLGGLAKQVLHWVRQSRHCSRCGSVTVAIAGTWGRLCSGCKSEHYPHIHPCAIVLVKKGNQILLARKAEWVPGRYGLLAGFVEFGESLEECAIREVREETGISIKNVQYVASQNWPFPAQLMAGFVAEYESGELEVDHNELEDARWFEIDKLPLLSPQRSIGRKLIDMFAV